mgnify:CR=1 FL=1
MTWISLAMHDGPDAALALGGDARTRRALQRDEECHVLARGSRQVEVLERRVQGKPANIRGLVVDELGHLRNK